MTRIKICGLRRMDDVRIVNETRPEMIGFIFDPTRRRYLPPEEAAVLRRALAPGIQAAGVFVNEDEARIRSIAQMVGLDWIQLHGSETDDAVRRLKRETGLPVIRAFRIDSPEDVNRALNSSADLILLDSGAGGTGSAFDWKLIRSISRKFVLAGGLGPENVREAIALTSPFAVDASSGLETEGRKDPDKIRRFVQTIRRIESGCTERK